MSYLVKDYMRKEVTTIDANVSALVVSKLMTEKEIGYIIVTEKAQPIGIVTEKDLIVKVMSKEKDSSNVKVSEIMSTPLITVNFDASLDDAINLMTKNRIRRVVVVKDHAIYGVFTTKELTKNFAKYQDRVARDLINAQNLYGANLEFGF